MMSKFTSVSSIRIETNKPNSKTRGADAPVIDLSGSQETSLVGGTGLSHSVGVRGGGGADPSSDIRLPGATSAAKGRARQDAMQSSLQSMNFDAVRRGD
jgi:hypothetical protein